MSHLTITQIRRVLSNTWSELSMRLGDDPVLFDLPHPEQQLLFEFSHRFRESLRSLAGDPTWDGLYFDASTAGSDSPRVEELVEGRPHIHVSTAELLRGARRQAATPDLAVNLHVVRSLPRTLELDEDGRPQNLGFLPRSIQTQAHALEESVRQLEQLSARGYDGYLYVVYVNRERRETAVDTRLVASWASWRGGSDGISWASRHFRPTL